MIPTTATNNSSSNNINNNSSQTSTSAVIGIASLIFEGRAICEDEFINPIPNAIMLAALQHQVAAAASTTSHVAVGGGRQSPGCTSSNAARYVNIIANPNTIRNVTMDSTHQRWTQKICQLRQSSPSTIRDTYSPLMGEQDISIEAQNLSGSVGNSGPEMIALNIYPDSSSSSSSSSSAAASHNVRRVAMAASSSSAATENFLHSLQSLATTCLRGGSSGGGGGSVGAAAVAVAAAAATTTDHPYTGYRYNFLPSSPMPASTVITPNAATSPKYGTYLTTPLPRSAATSPYPVMMVSSSPSSASGSNANYSSSSSSSSSSSCGGSSGAMMSANGILVMRGLAPQSSKVAGSAEGGACTSSGLQSPKLKKKHLNCGKVQIPTPTAITIRSSSPGTAKTTTTSYPRQGPHCDQFLKKMGLAKGEAAEAEDHICDMSHSHTNCFVWRANCLKMEEIIARNESICIEVYLGPVSHKILLEQWIITHKEREKVPSPTMTLPSLCSAIRSQLYFSQISSWCDLIKKSDRTIIDTGRLTTTSAVDAATTTTTTSGGACCSSRRPHLNIYYCIKRYDSTASFNSKPNVHNFPNVTISENCIVSVCLKSLPRINGGIPRISGECTTTTSSASSLIVAASAAASGVGGAGVTTAAAAPSSAIRCAFFDASGHLAALPSTSSSAASTSAAINSRHHYVSSPAPPLPVVPCDILIPLNDHRRSLIGAAACQEKGKHKCIVVADAADDNCDEGDDDDDDDYDCISDCSGATTNGDSNCSVESGMTIMSNLSHREKQLLKYRKRMLKRDKKTTTSTRKAADVVSSSSIAQRVNAVSSGSTSYSQPMQLDVKFGDANDKLFPSNGQLQQQSLESTDSSSSIKSIHPPLYQRIPQAAKKSNSAELVQTEKTTTQASVSVEMISTGTQTTATTAPTTMMMMWNCCDQCGNEKSLVCLNCDRSDSPAASGNAAPASDVDEMDSSPTTMNKADLLLQAIQRTPKAVKNKKQIMWNNNHANDGAGSENGSSGSTASIRNGGTSVNGGGSNFNDCQVCKRQKTQHHYRRKYFFDVDQENVFGAADAASTSISAIQHNNNNNNYNGSSCVNQSLMECCSGGGGNAKPSGAAAAASCVCTSIKMEDDDENDVAAPEKLMINHNNTANMEVHSSPSDTTATGKTYCQYQITSDGYDDADAAEADNFKTPNNAQIPSSPSSAPPRHNQFSNQMPTKPNLLLISSAYNSNVNNMNNNNNNNHHINRNNNSKSFMSNGSISSSTHGDYNGKNLYMLHLPHRKSLPKVNLTPIFCNPSSSSSLSAAAAAAASLSPIPISCCPPPLETHSSFTFDNVTIKSGITIATSGSTGSVTTTTDNNNIPVQKSFSAPTLPNSPSLSPRFAKQAAIYKRRSRHLSDRSDRSSLGSDEQFSDEDLENGTMYSPATSPMKVRSQRITVAFGRRPLLGNLEESLLQKRLIPKTEVAGFKVLLGASGGFCPTQLTIPAAAYFYELHGQALNAPYVCDIRLPRKGYSIPRTGTVQATLLNPMGTVVRMFVIPYDFHDMPPLHQTFIRQRILAENLNDLSLASSSSSSASSKQQSKTSNGHSSTVGLINGYNISSVNGFAATGSFCSSTSNSSSSISQNNNNRYRLSPSSVSGLQSGSNLGHFITTEQMKRLRYSIHLRFQTSRSGRLTLHTDIRLLISRRTDCDTAAAHAKGVLEAPNNLIIDTVTPSQPKYSARQESPNKI